MMEMNSKYVNIKTFYFGKYGKRSKSTFYSKQFVRGMNAIEKITGTPQALNYCGCINTLGN